MTAKFLNRHWRLFRYLPLWTVTAICYILILAPLMAIALASFDGSTMYYFHFPPSDLSLKWYRSFPDKYIASLKVSFVVGVTAALISTILGAAAALGLMRGNFKHKDSLATFLRVPVQIPFVVTGVVLLQFFYYVGDLGFDLLGNLSGMIIAHIFFTLPYAIGTVTAALSRMNPNLEEAAQSLGASALSTFFSVVVPAMKPGLFAGFFYGFIVSFGDVPVSLFLAGEHTITFPVQVFQSLQFDFDPAVLSLSTIVVILSGLAVVFVQRVVGLDLVLPSKAR